MPLPPVEIPLALDCPLWSMRTTLDGREYVLGFDYLEREGRWILNVSDVAGAPLATGIKVVANWPLLRQFVNPALPPGNLIATDVSNGGGEPPDFQALGRRVRLLYFPKVSSG